MKRNPRRHPWPLAKLVKENRAAPAVWLALNELAAGSPVVTPTRARLCEASGLNRLPTISRALSALEKAGWIHRKHVPVFVGKIQSATLLRIILCRRERKSFQDSLKRELRTRTADAGAHAAGKTENSNKNLDAPEPAESFVPLGPDGLPPAVSAAQKRLRGES